MRVLWIPVLILCVSLPAAAQTWRSMGPSGGDVLSLAQDSRNPNQLYLGTTDGHVFGSQDAGGHWSLLGRVSQRSDSVVTSIVVDPRNSSRLYAATWTQDSSAGGGIFRSDDGGADWSAAGLAGEAVRALTQSPSDPDRLIAGTLDGVFATSDAGHTWQRISPSSNREIRNVDSVAVDPRRPDVVYAGTFHLPWKSADGGKTWVSIHAGMIDDSDVMSILVDRKNPERVFASSCSGIYRSEDGAAEWQKIQGIPYSARRTHVILQDPQNAQTIYAATTEGLWKSGDGGASWRQMTPADWVVNAVVLPANRPGRVVLGTDERGVMVSDDGGEHFRAANDGFNHQAITTVAFDSQHPGRILAVLAHAPEPIVMTDDAGKTWKPLGPGLTMRSLKQIFASPDGWWAALETGGLMRYDAKRAAWVRAEGLAASSVSSAEPRMAARTATSRRRTRHPIPSASSSALSKGPTIDLVVNDMAFSQKRWFAATQQGLFFSDDRGEHWQRMMLGPVQQLPISSVRVSGDGQSLWTVSLRGMILSADGGKSWTWRDLPLSSGGALRLEMIPNSPGQGGGPRGGTFMATARNGLFISRDGGNTWKQAGDGLPQLPVEDLAVVNDVFVVSLRIGGIYFSLDSGRSWSRANDTLGDGFFPAVAAEGAQAEVLAASASDGIYAVTFKPTTSVSRLNPLP